MKKLITIMIILTIISGLIFISGCDEKEQKKLGPGAPVAATECEDELCVSVYDKTKAYDGTTLFPITMHESSSMVELDMDGNILWELALPDNIAKGSKKFVGFDAELLDNGNILIVVSNSGVYEIDREGNIIWSVEDPDASHDADRLDNGNTLVLFGNDDEIDDPVIKEYNPEGEIVWEWYLPDYYEERFPYDDYYMQGWGHNNAVQRLSNGNTMISIRNFYLTVIVDENGDIVKEYDWSVYGTDTDPHEPVIDEDKNTLLVCLQNDAKYEGRPLIAIEVDLDTEEVLWTYTNGNLRTARDCDRLPNGNTLIVAVDTGGTVGFENLNDDYSVMLEVDAAGEVVWRLDMPTIVGKFPGYFFKAERI